MILYIRYVHTINCFVQNSNQTTVFCKVKPIFCLIKFLHNIIWLYFHSERRHYDSFLAFALIRCLLREVVTCKEFGCFVTNRNKGLLYNQIRLQFTLDKSNFQFDSVSDYGDNWNQVYGFEAEPALLQDLLYLLEYLSFHSLSTTFIAISQHLYSPRYVKSSFEVQSNLILKNC